MYSSILFLISSISLVISFLLIKKTDNKLNIIKWISIAIILLFCLNSLIAYILSYMHIKTNLLTISCIYILLDLIIYFKYIRLERQTYYFNKKDIIYLSIIFCIVFFISFIRFGFPFSIIYQTVDPAIHYQSSYSFYKESILLNFVTEKTIFNFETWRFGSYTNLGLIFKLFSPFMTENDFYSIYILYDILTLFVTAVLFYYLIDNGHNHVIKIIGAILFMLGYPLNNLLIGFFYVGHASCIIITILLIIKELYSYKDLFPLLFILNIGLTFTYYLFCPFVFLAEFIYFFKTKNMIRKYFLIFVIPILLGLIYFIIPTFNNTNMDLMNQIKLDGYFYNDVLGNSLLFFPIVSYYFYNKVKEKKLDFELIMFIVLFIFMFILNILMLANVIMPYYVSKYYYILWILCFLILFRTYDDYYNRDKFIFKNYSIFMLITIVLSITNIESQIIDLNEGEWNMTTPNMLFNVYNYNLKLIKKPLIVFSANEINDVKKLAQENNQNFLTNTESERILWLINFLKPNKVNCPVNKTYECVHELYNVELNEYLNNYDTSNITYIYFANSVFWSEPYIDNQVLELIEDSKSAKIVILPSSYIN